MSSIPATAPSSSSATLADRADAPAGRAGGHAPSPQGTGNMLPSGRPKRHTILVVDDEPDVVKSVKDLLRLQYRVLGATGAGEAMEVLRREDVHIVMTDQRMPDMTGVQFLKHTRGENPEAVRLLFTGYADIRAVIDAINEGNVYRYITKPWDPDELQALIREACERYDLIVERKHLLHILRDQNQELEKANSDLARANADLRRANDLKFAFIQVASHELRTPLTILQGMIRLAAMSVADGSEPLAGYLARIERAGQRLQHLVDQIIAMLVAGRFERRPEWRPTDMAGVLNEAADDVRPFIELRRQTLAVDLSADLGTLEVEAPRIRDSVNHLLLNAIKFTPDGGTVSLAGRRTDEGGVEIRVSDSGCGMDVAHCERLFEPFFTGYDVSRHSSGTYEHGRKGLGLGLPLVKRFVEMHGGTVQVKSEPGRGTTFTLTLPARPTEAAASAAAGNGETKDGA
jgi:signal transduction histidine kinase